MNELTRNAVVDGEVFDPGREAFVEPKVGPPLHRHQVAEPLMGNTSSFHGVSGGPWPPQFQ
jgi:hypothetical protein